MAKLLRRANAAYKRLITMDKGICHQQDLTGMRVILVGLRAKANRLADTRVLMLRLLAQAQSGQFQSVS